MGNSTSVDLPLSGKPVHPHACGELLLCSKCLFVGVGSSPRLWGTRQYKYLSTPFNRFIPTLVGNSFVLVSPAVSLPVHPHACGELPLDAYMTPYGFGSSPRLWGTLLCESPHFIQNRFIPTLVGNSFFAIVTGSKPTVHPHACGELTILFGVQVTVYGSSPRLWGTLLH